MTRNNGMGGGVSTEDFATLKATYDSLPSETADEAVLKALNDALADSLTLKKSNSPEKKLERNINFLIACGKFDKVSKAARATLGTVQYLFDEGVDVDYVDEDGWSGLHHAAGEGHLNVVEYLIG